MRTARLAAGRVIVAAAVGVAAWDARAWLDEIPEPERYRSGLETYFGETRSLVLPPCEESVVFKASVKQANFTGFENARGVEVKGGAVHFTAASNTVLLDWGNYGGRQELKDIERIPACTKQVRLKVRQAGGAPSQWSLVSWSRDRDVVRGKRGAAMQYRPAELAAGEWRDLTLVPGGGVRLGGLDADGVEIKVETEPGARFEIENIQFVEVYSGGYVRHEFTLPDGAIWRAMANVGGVNEAPKMDMRMFCALEINGRRVDRTTMGVGLYEAHPVDIRPYLKPGKNCIGIHAWRDDNPPFVFVSGTVIMESGETIPLHTDAAWQYSPTAAEGWSRPGFEASGWKTGLPAGTGPGAGFQEKLPGWTGCLDVIQPGRKDLTFRDNQPARMQVRIPAGLAAKTPAVAYELAKSDKYGRCEKAGEGEIKMYTRQDGSLVYALDAGTLKAGVYTLAVALRDGAGQTLEERPLEPLLVVRTLDLKDVACEDVKEGLDLDREIEIDFTDAGADRPTIEVSTDSGKPVEVKTPSIIKKDGLTYREMAGKKMSSFISYRLEFKHPGDLYLCEVEYPDNAERCIEVFISKSAEGIAGVNTVIGVGAETGGKFYTTGQIQTLHFLFTAPGGRATLDVRNVQSGWPAAVKSAALYHVKGDLVSAGSGRERAFGIHTERDYPGNSFARVFRPEIIQNNEQVKAFAKLPYMQQVLVKLEALREVTDKYAQYLKFCGQNTHVMGCFQYWQANSPYIPFYHDRVCASVVPCLRSVLAHTLEANGITFYAGVEFLRADTVHSAAPMAVVRKGAESVWVINDRGEPTTISANWLHPAYQGEYFRLLRDLDTTFGDLANYRGVHNVLSPCHGGGYITGFPCWSDTGWDPLTYSYDDLTFRLFAEDTGLDLGIDPRDPDRFAKRAGLIRAHPDYQQRFIAWRNDQLVKFLSKAAAIIRAQRKDVRFVNAIGMEEPDFFRKALESGRPLKDVLKDFGADFDTLAQIEALVLMRWSVAWNATRSTEVPGFQLGAQMPETWVTRENEEYTALLDAFPERGVLCRTSWDEGGMATPGGPATPQWQAGKFWNNTDWLLDVRTSRCSPQPGGVHAREALIQGLITSDPEILLTGFVDAALNGGHEQTIRRIMRVYTRLPRDHFRNELDTGLKSNLAIRSLSRDGQSWLVAANPGYWAIDGTIVLEAGGKIVNLADGREAAKGGQVGLKVRLEPFGLAAWRIESDMLKVLSYATGKPGARERAFMQDGIVGRVNTLLEDPKVKRVLSPADRAYMREITGRAADLLARDQYAAAWALLKTPTFWRYWKYYLEKAAAMAVFLPAQVAVPERADGLALPKLTAVKAERVDLEADLVGSPEWQAAPASAEFLTLDSGMRTFNPTVVKTCYSDRHLYFGFICADADPRAVKALGAPGDDALLIVFQPDSGVNIYYQMTTNAKGAGYDQKCRFGVKDNAFQSGKEVVCKLYPGYWTAVVKVPRETIGATGRLDKARANFFRTMRENLLQTAAWSPVPGRRMAGGKAHDQSRWGDVLFQ